MKLVLLGLLAMAAVSTAAAPQTFTGAITDSVCASAPHAQMGMGSTDAECTNACVDEHDATYVLYDGKTVYTLSDQQTPKRFAGRRVTVVGTLQAGTTTIRVESIGAVR